jgi:SP family facilitated glucose transporter-like MFS transporter 1
VTAVGVLLVVFSLVLVALFAIGPGTIPWLMVPELFLQQVRPVAVSMATSVNWLANLSISLSLSYILKHLHPYGTSIFVVTCGVLWFILYVYLPETRGRSIHQVTADFRTRKLSRTILP